MLGGDFPVDTVGWWVGGVSWARERVAVGVTATFSPSSFFQSVQIGILEERIEDM